MVRLIRTSLQVFWYCLPWAIRAARRTFWLMMIGFVNVWVGFPTTADRMANAWIDMAVQAGFPTLHTRPLYWVLYVVAVGTNVAGWIVLSLFTVFVLGLVF